MKKYSLKKDGDMYLDQDGVSWDTPLGWLWSGILGGCWCGSSEELANDAFIVLSLFATDKSFEKRQEIYDHPEYEVIAHWMDKEGLIEHGTSVAGSWLTDKGEQIHQVLISVLNTEDSHL